MRLYAWSEKLAWIYLLKQKNEVLHIFQQFHKMIQTQYSKKIRILRSDNGGEFVNHQFSEYFKKHGLIHETTCPQTPQQNGIAERKNRHILETARALLLGAHVPHHHWTDAVTTTVYLINRMPSKVLEFKTPLQTLSSLVTLPTIQMLPPRVFGCVVFVHLHKNQRTKLDPCAIRCLFLGYGVHQKGYRCYDPITQRIYVTMDVTFLEFDLFYSSASSNSSLQRETPEEESNWMTFDWFKDIDTPSTEGFDNSCQTQTDPMGTEVQVCPPEVEVLESPLSPVPDNLHLLRISLR
jgi:hypothetical protein